MQRTAVSNTVPQVCASGIESHRGSSTTVLYSSALPTVPLYAKTDLRLCLTHNFCGPSGAGRVRRLETALNGNTRHWMGIQIYSTIEPDQHSTDKFGRQFNLISHRNCTVAQSTQMTGKKNPF